MEKRKKIKEKKEIEKGVFDLYCMF